MAIPKVGFVVANRISEKACGATHLEGAYQSLIEIGLALTLDCEIVLRL